MPVEKRNIAEPKQKLKIRFLMNPNTGSVYDLNAINPNDTYPLGYDETKKIVEGVILDNRRRQMLTEKIIKELGGREITEVEE